MRRAMGFNGTWNGAKSRLVSLLKVCFYRAHYRSICRVWIEHHKVSACTWYVDLAPLILWLCKTTNLGSRVLGRRHVSLLAIFEGAQRSGDLHWALPLSTSSANLSRRVKSRVLTCGIYVNAHPCTHVANWAEIRPSEFNFGHLSSILAI